MAVRIEDAGFEIRDLIAWVYGSGFPKSHDISKAIDKIDASQEQEQRRLRFTEWVRSTGVTSRQIDEATGANMGGHYTTAASQPAIMTREHLELCRGLFESIPEWVEREVDIRSVESKNFAEREVVGVHDSTSPGCNMRNGMLQTEKDPIGNITAPATEAAKQWQGWGTALKPAFEPVTMARKPFASTVAENVLEHGTGGLNVDGCRVGTDGEKPAGSGNRLGVGNAYQLKDYVSTNGGNQTHELGRWPANFIHDGSEEAAGLLGDAARFFYTAKASKADRDAGCKSLSIKDVHRYGSGIGEGVDPKAPAQNRNHHPTVKPTDLMRYLCRLVTPPGGIVLDPFTGSGSTGKAAILEGFRFIGIEREAEYIEIARARIQREAEKPRQPTLFD
jgi:hypothetical protein